MKNYESLSNELMAIVQAAKPLPMINGKIVIDGEKVLRIVEELRDNVPGEIQQAKALAADRKKIINDAKNEAEEIVRQAHERRNLLVEENEITKEAKLRAEDIVNEATLKAKELRRALNQYLEGTMQKTEKALADNLSNLHNTFENLKAIQNREENNF